MRRAYLVPLAALVVTVPAALAAGFTFHGSIGGGDPLQKGQLVRDDPATTCDAATAAELKDLTPTHYESYRFTSSSGSPQCVTVDLVIDPLLCPVNNPIQSAAYTPSFDPANITANYLGDSGASPEPSKTYSVTVPARASFDITVNETNPNAGCNGYTLTVAGAGIGTTPTAAGVRSFTAKAARSGVLLRWRTAGELRLLGFNVYREHSSRRVRVNPRLIPAVPAPGAHLYTWLDRNASGSARQYWLQQVSPDGSRSWYGRPAAVR